MCCLTHLLDWFASCWCRPWWIQKWSQTAAPGCWPLWRSCWWLLIPSLQMPAHLHGKHNERLLYVWLSPQWQHRCRPFTWEDQDEGSSKDVWVRRQASEAHGYICCKISRYVASYEIIKCPTPCQSHAGCPWVERCNKAISLRHCSHKQKALMAMSPSIRPHLMTQPQSRFMGLSIWKKWI